MALFYFAAWTDSGCLLGCDHQHETVTSAAACCGPAGSYVIAVENGVLRALNDEEEAEFQCAMYGIKKNKQPATVIAPINPADWLLN